MSVKLYNVGMYIRLSRENTAYIGEDSLSIENQQAMLSKFVDMMPGWIEKRTYIDNGASGGNFNRQGFRDMMVDVQTLNLIVEHKRFPYLISLVKRYLDGTIAEGVMARNDIIDMATAALADFAKENLDHKAEVRDDVRYLRSEKLGEHEAELEKIKSTFVVILKDIKNGFGESAKPAPPVATADFMREVWTELQDKPRAEITADDVSAAVVNMVGKATPLDGRGGKG